MFDDSDWRPQFNYHVSARGAESQRAGENQSD